MEGAQPTSLTQSLWASSFWSSFHWPSSSLWGRKSEAVRMSRPPSSFTRVLLPELHQVVAAPGDKALDVVWFLSRWLVDQTPRNHGGPPTHCVTANLQEATAALTHTPGSRLHTQLRALLTVCALLILFTSHCWSPVKVSREMAPSELPQARTRPKSYGPQQTEFTAERR